MVDISAWALLTATLPVIIYIFIGYLFRKKNWVSQDFQYGMMRLVIWIFTPGLIIDRVLGNPILKDFNVVWKILSAGFLSISLGIIICFFSARFFGIFNKSRAKVFAYCNGIFNYGYLALPICISLCPSETIGAMLLFNIGVELGIWTIGLAVISGELNIKKIFTAILNPIFITMLITLSLNFFHLDSYLSLWIGVDAHSLGACMIPCGLLLVGMSLPILLNGFKFQDEIQISLGAIFMRLIFLPTLMVSAAIFIPAIPNELRYILIIQAAMPPAMLPIVIVQYYNGDAKLALRIVLIGTITCIITLPFWIKFGFWLLPIFS